MPDLLNSLNVPSAEPSKSWAQEVADAGVSAAPASVPEPVAADDAQIASTETWVNGKTGAY